MNFRNIFEGHKKINPVSNSELVNPELVNQEPINPEPANTETPIPAVTKEGIANKVLMVGAAASLAFGSVEAQNAKKGQSDSFTQKSEINTDNNLSDKRLGSEKTYQASSSDFLASASKGKESLLALKNTPSAKNNPSVVEASRSSVIERSSVEAGEELARINFKINFVVDKADIPAGEEKNIANKFSEFLKNINQTNFQQAIEADWSVVSGCSEEPTNKWGDLGNENLALGRGLMAADVIDKTKNNFDYSSLGLSLEQGKALQNKKVNVEIVREHPENLGVTYVTDLKNPETGLKYSKEEVDIMKKEDPKKFVELKEGNRVAYFKAEIKTPAVKEIVKEIPSELLKLISKYKRVVFATDKSESMADKVNKLYAEIKKEANSENDTEYLIVNYSDKLEKIESLDLKNIGKNINNYNGSSQERAIDALQELINKLPVKEKTETVLAFIGDEALQSFSYAQLEKAEQSAKKAGHDIAFVFYLQNGEESILSLKDVMNNAVEYMNLDKSKGGDDSAASKTKTMNLKVLKDKNGKKISLPIFG